LQAHHCAWATQFFRGRFKASRDHIEAGTALYDLERHAHHRHLYLGHDPGVCSLNFAACVQFALGYPDRALAFVREGFALAKQIDHVASYGNTLWRACEAHAMRGEIEAVLRTASALIEFSDAHGLPIPRSHATAYRGWAQVRSGNAAEGMAQLVEAQQALSVLDARVHATVTPSLHADALRVMGRYEEGLAQLSLGLKLGETSGERSYAAWLHRIRATLLLHARGTADPEVEAALREAILIAREQDAKGWEIGPTTDLARLWAEQGRRTEARELLAPVYAWFTEGFDIADLIEAKRLLGELS
jgi:predicted ATPase